MKVALLGPPRSGKSVFLGGLTQNLPRNQYYLFRACPDGEGAWTWRSEAAARYRRKGRFTPQLVDWYVNVLGRELAPITLIDLGGIPSSENRRILSEGEVEYAIILSSDPAAIPVWREFAEECGVEIIATLHSDYHASADVVRGEAWTVHYLERGVDVSNRPAIQAVAEKILALADSLRWEQKKGQTQIHIADIAAMVGKEALESTLPNGRVVTRIEWEGRDLVEVARHLHNRSGEFPGVVHLDGPAPGWLITALVHELHPRFVRVNSPDGFVAIGCQKPSGEGSGPNLRFEVRPGPDGFVVVHAEALDPSEPFSPEDLDKVVPPAVKFGSRVIISGRLPNWMTASLAMAYHGQAAAVAIFQPGVGATVAITHTRAIRLGEVIPLD